MRVESAAVVVENLEAGGTDGCVGQPLAPRPPDRVGDDDSAPHPRGRVQPGSQGARARVGIEREEHDGARLGVGGIDAGRGHHKAVPRLDDAQATRGRGARRDEAHRLCGDRVLAIDGGDDASFGLAHDLARDDDDIAVTQTAAAVGPGRRRDQCTDELGEIVTGPHFGEAG